MCELYWKQERFVVGACPINLALKGDLNTPSFEFSLETQCGVLWNNFVHPLWRSAYRDNASM